MKYHYQYVSSTTVRIELIAEDKKETAMLHKLTKTDPSNLEIASLYKTGLKNYNIEIELIRLKFMNFPTVALCSFKVANKEKIQELANLG